MEDRKVSRKSEKGAPRAIPPAVPASPEMGDQVVSAIEDAKFEELVERVHKWESIRNDYGKDAPFAGEARDAFVADLRNSFRFLKRLVVVNFIEIGRTLSEIRDRQRKYRQWNAFLETVGLVRSQAHRFIQVYERLGDHLGQYAYLGVSKLEIVSRLKDQAAAASYLERNAVEIESDTVQELKKKIKAKTSAPKSTRTTDDAYTELIGHVQIEISKKKKTLVVKGLTGEQLDDALEVIRNMMLS